LLSLAEALKDEVAKFKLIGQEDVYNEEETEDIAEIVEV